MKCMAYSFDESFKNGSSYIHIELYLYKDIAS